MTTVISSKEHPRIVSIITNAKGQIAFALLALCVVVFYNSTYYVYSWNGGVNIRIMDGIPKVSQVLPGGGGDEAGVRVGDTVLTINGQLVKEWGKRPFTRAGVGKGDVLTYQLQRGDQVLTLSIRSGSLLDDLSVSAAMIGMHFLSASFWTIGLLLILFVPANDVRARLIGLGWLLASIAIAAGSPGYRSSSWGSYTVFQVSWCCLAFILPTSHLYFPVPSFVAQRRYIIYAIAVVALILSTLFIIDEWFLKPYRSWLWGLGIQFAIQMLFFFRSWPVSAC